MDFTTKTSLAILCVTLAALAAGCGDIDGTAPAESVSELTAERSPECELTRAGDACAPGDCTRCAPRTGRVAVGYGRTCAVRAEGTVYCWDGLATPTAVPGLSDAVAVAVGNGHACALRRTGEVACWGSNYAAQLGDGTRGDVTVTTPVAVAGLRDAVAIATAYSHTCAVRRSGELVCWGDNHNHQLGPGASGAPTTPVAVAGVTDAVAVATAATDSCAVRRTGEVVCWGYNYRVYDPVAMRYSLALVTRTEVTDAVSIAGATPELHTCVLRRTGAVVCWGNNDSGQLGAPTETTGPVTSLRDAVAVVTGTRHTCALRRTGEVVCWGRNLYGALGDGTTDDRATPAPVVGIRDAVGIAAALQSEHTCALRRTGEVVCWGQLRDPNEGSPVTPVPVQDLAGVDMLASGPAGRHTCALRRSGRVACWGANESGQLGDGHPSVGRTHPVAVSGLTDAVAVSAGALSTCAARRSGEVVCWGSDGTSVPSVVEGVNGAVAVARGWAHACALRRGGTVLCWGVNVFGELGTETELGPAEGLHDAVAVAAGELVSCAVRRTGGVLCWGFNGFGQLGDGTFEDRAVPTPVVGLRDATAVTFGQAHTCALRRGGEVVCWGQVPLGAGVTTTSATPTAIAGVTGAVSIAAGSYHTCAVRRSGSVVCWGDGFLGNGTVSETAAPVVVAGLTDAVSVVAGEGHTCALRRNGAAVCWGMNDIGQVGNGLTASAIPRPFAVASLPR